MQAAGGTSRKIIRSPQVRDLSFTAVSHKGCLDAHLFVNKHMSSKWLLLTPANSDATRAGIFGRASSAPAHSAPIALAASCGVETGSLQRPSIRAGLGARHPILSTSFDQNWKPCGRRSHLYDGSFERPGKATGRLRQNQGRCPTRHRHNPYASLRCAPSGNAPLFRKRQSATRNVRATATIPMRLRRLPPPPKRSLNQQCRALSGGYRIQLQARSVIIQRTCRVPDLVMPCSRARSPL
jgi:hypothetical protein